MNNTIKIKKRERLWLIDFFRIISAFFVFLFHSNIHIGCEYGIFTPFISQGAIFMVAFFILSGFTLYYNYNEKNLTDICEMKRFYIKRIIAIYPLYLVLYLLYLIFGNNISIINNIVIAPTELLLVQSFFSSLFSVAHNGGTWFISCITFAYLLFPFLNCIVKQLKTFSRLTVLVITYLLCSYAPIIPIIFKTNDIYSNPFFRALEFLCGMIICAMYLERKNKETRFRAFWIFIESIIFIVSITSLQYIGLGDYNIYIFIAIPYFGLIAYQLSTLKYNKHRLFNNRIVKYLSNISFTFFLAQFFAWEPIKYLMNNTDVFLKHANIKKFLLSLIICLVISILLHEIIEKPTKKILSKRFY